MDPRNKKPYDFVSIIKNLTEEVQKARRMQMKWFQKYEWLLDEHVKLEEEIQKLCNEKRAVNVSDAGMVKATERSCMPAPMTTSGEYGWIATKPEFQLEKYGSYSPQYPDPLRVKHLSGSVPILAAGKPLYC